MKLAVGKEYNLNNVKEIKVTKDFLGLDRSVIKCQNVESIEECRTRKYIDALMTHCRCLPFSIRQADQVLIIVLTIISSEYLGTLHHSGSKLVYEINKG